MKTLTLLDLKEALDRCREATGVVEFVVVGSQAILGSAPESSELLRTSQDVDLFARCGATLELNEKIYKQYGPDTDFEKEHRYYLEPVGEWTMFSALPDWQERLVKVEAPAGAIGWCISPLDIAYNKADAGREKDLVYLAELFRTKIVRPSELKSAMDAAEIPEQQAALVHSRVQEAIRRSLH